jgi:two-component system chemotaxis response regulator CheB
MTSHDGVVVIAAAAENLDALIRLIHMLPPNFPAALVVHVHGLKDSLVPQLAEKAKTTPAGLDVITAPMGAKIWPGCLYIALAGRALVFTAPGVLALSTEDAPEACLPHADQLFESAARFHGNQTVGVVLSGLGSDGTQGLRAISAAGGKCVVQSPSEAVYPAMPWNALMRDSVEYSVMLDQMGKLLFRLVNASSHALHL